MSVDKHDDNYLHFDLPPHVKDNVQTGKHESKLYEEITEIELSDAYENDKRDSTTQGKQKRTRKTKKRWVMILIIIALCFGSMVIAAGLTSAIFLQTASGIVKLIFYD